MARTVHELRDLRINKIALVRKGFRPVHQGAVITIVKSEQEDRSVSDETTRTEASVVDRLSKAIASLLKSDAPQETEAAEADPEPVDEAAGDTAASTEAAPESVEKADGAELASMEVSPDGAHAAFDGTHTHGHVSHYAMLQHDHEHSHDGDAAHYHSHVSKAEETLPEGWRIVSADELRSVLGAAPVAKADSDDAADVKVSKLIGQLESLVDKLKSAQADDEAADDDDESDDDDSVSKAELEQIVTARVEAVLDPIAKALEDLGIERARIARTPNVTAVIDPHRNPAAEANARSESIKDMTFGDAIRHLMHR